MDKDLDIDISNEMNNFTSSKTISIINSEIKLENFIKELKKLKDKPIWLNELTLNTESNLIFKNKEEILYVIQYIKQNSIQLNILCAFNMLNVNNIVNNIINFE